MTDVGSLDKARILLTVKQFSEKHSAFSQGSLRHLIFFSRRRHTSRGEIPGNGLDAALVRVGRRILIDEARFFAWLDAQQKDNPDTHQSRINEAGTKHVEEPSGELKYL